jgi:hypothetical protein
MIEENLLLVFHCKVLRFSNKILLYIIKTHSLFASKGFGSLLVVNTLIKAGSVKEHTNFPGEQCFIGATHVSPYRIRGTAARKVFLQYFFLL